MDRSESRVTLARAMFPDYEFKNNIFKEPIMAPAGRWDKSLVVCSVPDPFTDANDCEALILWLSEKGWQVEIHWQNADREYMAAGAYVHIWNRDTEEHIREDYDRDRWKECVADVAVRILSTGASDHE